MQLLEVYQMLPILWKIHPEEGFSYVFLSGITKR